MSERLESSKELCGTDHEKICMAVPPVKPTLRRRKALYLAGAILLLCLVLGISMSWCYQIVPYMNNMTEKSTALRQDTFIDMSTTIAPSAISLRIQEAQVTSLVDDIQCRKNARSGMSPALDDDDSEAAATTEVAVTTDSDGTWYIESTPAAATIYPIAAASSSSQAVQPDPPASSGTTTETASLTDHIVLSYTTLSSVRTVTMSPSASATDPTRRSSSSTHRVITPASPPLSFAPHIPSILPSSHTTTISSPIPPQTCPWATCHLPPKSMDVDLCQMLDPCFFEKGGYIPKPPSQGGTCACLCESGYCLTPTLKNGRGTPLDLGCAQWNCCHQCGCYVGNPMWEQRGRGNC